MLAGQNLGCPTMPKDGKGGGGREVEGSLGQQGAQNAREKISTSAPGKQGTSNQPVANPLSVLL